MSTLRVVAPRRRFAAARRWHVGAYLPVACAVAAGCGRCGEPKVAELVATVERVERDYAGKAEGWQPASTGEHFAIGDGVRTFARSRAELALEPSGRLRIEQDTTVRFSDRAAGAPQRLSIERGAVELETQDVEIELRTEGGGLARAQRGTKVRVRRSAAATRFDVQVGQVQVERGGERRSVGPGDGFELEVGKTMLEPEPPAANVAARAASDAGALDAGAPPLLDAQGVELHFDPAPGRVELTLPAGESAALHHPEPPVFVRVAYGGCPGELVLEATSGTQASLQRTRGRAGAVLRLRAGQYRYRVLCIEGARLAAQAAAEGTLRVLSDSGTRRLSVAAPQATVDADGRRYTVRYQNVLPALTLRWPHAPSAPSYVLEVDPERGRNDARRLSTAQPSVSLPAGALGEGAYRFAFHAGSAHSPSGNVVIEFDHAGRTAYLAAPADRGFAAGATTQVAGSVVAGAAVTVAGVAVTIDPTGRFQTQAAGPIAEDALAVRVQHPAHGIHYYLRRVSHAAR